MQCSSDGSGRDSLRVTEAEIEVIAAITQRHRQLRSAHGDRLGPADGMRLGQAGALVAEPGMPYTKTCEARSDLLTTATMTRPIVLLRGSGA